jgi:Glycosyltransferase Family 4
MTAHKTRTAGRSAAPGKTQSRSWRVIHACEYARDVLPVAESQVAAGMQPYIVTPHGAGKAELFLSAENPEPYRPLSLLRSWQEVRQWRKAILDCDPENSADLVHAHSFVAGMAAVRNCSCAVYDFTASIEELAASARQCEHNSWLARSFRAAEQFVLSRAAAVIVHSLGMKQAALERGASPGSIFLIPCPRTGEDDLPTLVQLGKKYGEAYRHAASRRKPAGRGPGVTILQPLANCA